MDLKTLQIVTKKIRDKEDLEYQEREHEEEENEKENEEEKTDEEDHILGIHVAEAKRDPRNASYWSNPEVELIGVHVNNKGHTTQRIQRRLPRHLVHLNNDK